jgi:hypothetical protein
VEPLPLHAEHRSAALATVSWIENVGVTTVHTSITRLATVRVSLAVALAVLAAAIGIATGAAAPSPTRSKFAIHETKGRHIVVFNGSRKWTKKPTQIWLGDMANGGMLHLRWTSWTSGRATATGSSHPDHGVFRVRVVAFRTQDLTHIIGAWAYFRLNVRFKFGRSWRTERLAMARDSIGNDCWARVADIGNPNLGYTPWSP